VQNGTETDVDCGGSCAANCEVGQKCAGNADCETDYCNASKICSTAACTDTVKNGVETDVDCGGGSCPTCAGGKACKVASDCASIICSSLVCTTANCSDTVKNGGESDVDCGAVCSSSSKLCGDGKICGSSPDCSSGVCKENTCRAAACDDLVENGNETDVDCGGSSCSKCATGKFCTDTSTAIDSNCVSLSCSASTLKCLDPSCSDGKKNPNETDVDCGGTCSTKCGTGKACQVPGDCVSGLCTGNVCQAPPTAPLKVLWESVTVVSTNWTQVRFKIQNTTSSTLELAGYSVRYYYRRDKPEDPQLSPGGPVNWGSECGGLPCSNITTTHVAMSPTYSNAEYYVNLVFTGGSLAANATSAVIGYQFFIEDWLPPVFTNDYSYNGSLSAGAENPKMPVFLNSGLSWGTIPGS